MRAEHKRLNLLCGSVRSGKTYISLLAWALFVGSMPANYEFIMIGKTVTSLKRNCLSLLVDLVGKNNFQYNTTQKSATLFGRQVWIEGANDERSESKIRGITLAGAYCDELTLFPKSFFMMLLSRLSVTGAQLYATTNPDSPSHWVKTDIIDDEKMQKQLDLWHFVLDDNDYIDEQWKEDIKTAYTGVFYERLILGLWVIAEGLVYPMFDKNKHTYNKAPWEDDKDDSKKWHEYYVSVDYGTVNPMSMGLWRVYDDKAYRIKEYYFNSRVAKYQKTDEDYYADLVELVGDRQIEDIVVDPSAASFIATIKQHDRFSVRKANNDVLDGIRTTSTFLNTGRVFLHESCKDSIKEAGLYSWDSKAKADSVVKENDHSWDEIRYFVMTILRRRLG